ncbi:MAG: amidohydrolase family protein, partial [Caldilineaceae bacterium]|nr:amidohydrolase family protein [Caldilineaceae bacterium]
MSQPALLIHNANIYTANPAQPRAQAVVIHGHRIVFVGSDAEAIAWRTPQTETINGNGCALLPGLIDSHFHLLWGSLKLESLQLDGATDMAHLGELIQTYAAAHPHK